MKENKTKKENNTILRNKKVKVISITLLLLLVIVGVVSFAYSQNIRLAKNKNEEQEVQESKTQEIVLEDNKYMHVETDASGEKVPVPNGFVGSNATGENEIDSGYVIYALNEGETEDTVEINDTNKQEAQKTRNQYVWVPVPDISRFYGTDANGKKWGKIYNFTTGTYALNWSESNGVMRISSSVNSREPDVVKQYDTDHYLRTYGVSEETMHDFLMRQEIDFKKMIDSVEKYGGFYIGRYETGDLNKNQAVVRKGNTNISSSVWYKMYNKCKELEIDNINVTTGMIWGNQWDRTLMWLMECNAENSVTGKTKEEVISNSSSWGNYYDSTGEAAEGSGTIRPTGYNEAWNANNIYDMAGNTTETTMEAYSTGNRVCRGGGYGYSGSNGPASYRRNVPNFSWCGCRAALYVK